ncbi:hypothetical protein ACFY5D_16615 [Paeniglutamicibacter sp. NPDC012692]|uniref:hypothetical protein n=1 Tax=Paeniglutamicibacter sp. NPDC012692 TaxID=3364388 RepID=UPI0036A8FB60
MAEFLIFLGVLVTAAFAGGGLPRIITAVSDHKNRKQIAEDNSTIKVVNLLEARLTASENRISLLEDLVTDSHAYIGELIELLRANAIPVPERRKPRQEPRHSAQPTNEPQEFTD